MNEYYSYFSYLIDEWLFIGISQKEEHGFSEPLPIEKDADQWTFANVYNVRFERDYIIYI
jgi:hypothetical protein